MAKRFSPVAVVLIAAFMVLTMVPTGGAFDSAPQMPIDLGSASNFVILAETGITTIGATSIVGDIGVSPITGAAMTGFGLISDTSNQFATSTLVNGKVYAADYAIPTPTVMTTAIGDMQTAYNDAAGRTSPDSTELRAGNIGGMTLAPGLYKWSGGVTIPTDVTLSGSSDSIWIFQIAQNLDIGDGIHVILSGGAQAKNIFWQVAGQTTLGTTSVLNGNILDQLAIVMKTGATLNGRAMAQTAVTLDANAVIIPTDAAAPTVVSTTPANSVTDVAINNVSSSTFSEVMDPLTINPTTFILMQGATSITGAVTYSGVTATFTQTVDLAYNTVYTATITTGVKDLAGNALSSDHSWTFTTGTPKDTTAPTVISTIPVNTASGTMVKSEMTATFSEVMDPLTINTTTFTLMQGATPVTGSVTYSGVIATFSPAVDLAYNAVYTATVTTGVKDLAGNALASDYVWTFTTEVIVDRTMPTVVSTTPANAALGAMVNTGMNVTFSEVMDPLTINPTTFTLMQGAIPVSGAVTYSGLTAVFAPTVDLTANTTYTATITSGAKDLAGNSLASDFPWTFTTWANTGATPDTTAPTVISTKPANIALSVSINSVITVTFSEAMDPLTINTTTISLMQGVTPVAGAVTYSGVTTTFTPTVDLAFNTVYTATVTMGAKDLAGNSLASDFQWSFTTRPTTGTPKDTTVPTVISTKPVSSASGTMVDSEMTATFSEAMDPLTVSTVTFNLKKGATPVSGTVTYSGVTATFSPAVDLAFNTVYTATIKSGVKDLAGNAMAADKVWTFTTRASTGAAPDTTAPTVISTLPAKLALGVANNSVMTATFSEAMDPLTINSATFILMQGKTAVTGSVTYTGVKATFTPSVDLGSSLVYTATITNGAKDLAGNPLARNYVWSLTTGVFIDTAAPTVAATNPADAVTVVAINSAISATFSEAMDPLTISTVTFNLKNGATPISGTVTFSDVNAVFTPTNDLAASTAYTATITKGAKDLAGNALAANKVWTFTTGTTPDTIAPTVSTTVPADAVTGVAIDSSMSVTFSEAMNPLTVTVVSFNLKQNGTPVAGNVTYNGLDGTFTPTGDLMANTQYTATITTGAKDMAGNALASNYTWNFTTAEAVKTLADSASEFNLWATILIVVAGVGIAGGVIYWRAKRPSNN